MNHPEEIEQITLFRWAEMEKGRYPELRLMFHIPNGGKRSKTEAVRLKAAGVKAGVSDVFLPVARGGKHGLWVEMKAAGGKASPAQKAWISDMQEQGYRAEVCAGFSEAAAVIVDYLGGENERPERKS